MASTGRPMENTAASAFRASGAPGSPVPPASNSPFGARAASSAAGVSQGTISQK